MTLATEDAKKAIDIADQIGPMLAGLGPIIQGAILLQLVSVWVSGHYGETTEQNEEVRRDLLAGFTATVMELAALQDRRRKVIQ